MRVYTAIPALLFAAFLAWGAERQFGGNVSGFFYFGTRFAEGAALPHDPIVRPGSGYDGQFYYRIARQPLLPLKRLSSGQTSDHSVPGIDTPLLRYRRIVYPAMARLASLGSRNQLPLAFPLITVLSVWLGVFAMTSIFEATGWAGPWGMSFALLPGLVFAASRDLCDTLAVALIAAALLAIQRGRTPAAVALLIAAHLTHETTVVVSIGCFLSVARSVSRWREAAAYLVPIAATLLWTAIVASAFGGGAIVTGATGAVAIGPPFGGLFHKLQWLAYPAGAPLRYASLPTTRRFWVQEAFLVLPILIALALLARAAWNRRGALWLVAIPAWLLVVVCNDVVWQDAASYTRVTALVMLLALHAAAESPDGFGYAFLASLPLGTLASLVWCWDNWRGWSLAG